MGIFNLKYRDTRPILEVVLKEPDPGNPGQLRVHDLTGSTGRKLHIWLSDGSKLIRDMAVEGLETAGTLRYVWIATDWDPVSGGGTIGGLVAGPTIPLTPGQIEHRMEYEVIGPSGARLTFPNDGYDTLRILTDIGQGA
jgi:hypothetical protein